MSMGPIITLDEAKAIVATKTAPRVTEDSIKAKIARVHYLSDDDLPGLTVCVITMANGFMVLGKSAPASLSNFDAEVGKRYAFDDAFKQLWQLEGYLLREDLWQEQKFQAYVDSLPDDGPLPDAAEREADAREG